MILGLTALALLAGCGARAGADVLVYDTTPSWDGSTAIADWGSVPSGYTPTVGQTFVAPSNVLGLQSFTFYVTDFTPGDTLTFRAAVYAWSGSLLGGDASPQGATGSALYTSSNQVFVDNGGFQAVTVNTGGVSLTPGAPYVVLLTTTGSGGSTDIGTSLGLYELGLTGFGSHGPNNGGGVFNFSNGVSPSDLNTVPWDDYADYGDLAWTGIFTTASVPEPGTLTLGLLLAAGLAGSCRRGSRVATAVTSWDGRPEGCR
jgi:hypothetical protein